jgi:hypothetical protein
MRRGGETSASRADVIPNEVRELPSQGSVPVEQIPHFVRDDR